jgi:hypothetical protein
LLDDGSVIKRTLGLPATLGMEAYAGNTQMVTAQGTILGGTIVSFLNFRGTVEIIVRTGTREQRAVGFHLPAEMTRRARLG